MSQYVVPINETIDRLREELTGARQTEACLVADCLENVQEIAEEEDLSSEEYLSLVEASLLELITTARSVCKEIVGHCNEEGLL